MQTQANLRGLRLVTAFNCPPGQTTVLPRPERRSVQTRSVTLQIEGGFTVGTVLFAGTEVFVFIGNGTAAVDLKVNSPVALYSELVISLNSAGVVEVDNQYNEPVDYFYRKPSPAEIASASRVRHTPIGYSHDLISQKAEDARRRVRELTLAALSGVVLAAVGTGFVYKHTDTIGDLADAVVEKTAALLPTLHAEYPGR